MSDDVFTNNDGAQQLDLLSEVLPEVIAAFRRLDDEGRRKLYLALGTVFGLESSTGSRLPGSSRGDDDNRFPLRFSRDRSVGPKEFLQKKQPRTDVEKVACLAYFLTHYLDQRHFKTLDISKLNTEAAQIKFSNPAKAVNNAATLGYLTQASKGNKQLSANGELFVEALPDRDAARAAMVSARPRRRSKQTIP